MSPLSVTAFTAVNAMGRGIDAVFQSMVSGTTGLLPCRHDHLNFETHCGAVEDISTLPISKELADYDCRNNRLAQAGLETDNFSIKVKKARDRYGADRIGVLLGTSTSGIQATEDAYRQSMPDLKELPAGYHYNETHNLFATTDFVRNYLKLEGPAYTVSTACSSSAKVFASAWRLMHSGLCDAVVVGGVDSLCLNTLYGFNSLELVADEPCRPCAADRAGISIGEGAGYALLEWPDKATVSSGVTFVGYGESADAYHMSTPHPEGLGASLAMQNALRSADISASDISYINMHGTASQVNDAMEDRAITRVFGTKTPASSTKGWTGHTLGAAGITESVISTICLIQGFIPMNLNTKKIDPAFTSQLLLENRTADLNYVLTNSFGFGGSNASLIFAKVR